MKVILSPVRGFCAGVCRALELVRKEADKPDSRIYILHELVHNEFVISDLKTKGICIIEHVQDAPSGAVLIFSAHGVSDTIEQEAHARNDLKVIDATCPLVKRVQMQAANFSNQGKTVILFGKNGHREVEGILGRIPGEKILLTSVKDAEQFVPSPAKEYACLSQTTFDSDEVKAMTQILLNKNFHLSVSGAVCHATEERQNAVRELAHQCDVLFVVGSANSSNTKRLAEIAEREGVQTYRIDSAAELVPSMVSGKKCAGISAGASAPESLVEDLFTALKKL